MVIRTEVTPVPVGTNYILAKISNGTRTRYYYARGRLIVTPHNSGTPAEPCAYVLPRTQDSHGTNEGPGTIDVTTTPKCSWSAQSNDPSWLKITPPSSFNGSGTVTYTVEKNDATARVGTLTIAGKAFTVRQAGTTGPECSVSVDPSSHGQGFSSGSGEFKVITSRSDCTWKATASSGWITITNANIGTGDGTVKCTFPENSGLPRAGTITIESGTSSVKFVVNQDGTGGGASIPAPTNVQARPKTSALGALDYRLGRFCQFGGLAFSSCDHINSTPRTISLSVTLA